jgi:hypothetical protein
MTDPLSLEQAEADVAASWARYKANPTGPNKLAHAANLGRAVTLRKHYAQLAKNAKAVTAGPTNPYTRGSK